ncbi:MAG: hypothetical protein LBP72_06790 [Dysgonamonadaceae bacterium]|jgi:hypothetical protein|nr:hypothetical protein [Dysgonamonadaceae bacterium]
MKNDNDVFREFRESLTGLNGNLHVLETSVPVEKQIEYFHYSEEVRKNNRDESVDEQIDILNSQDSSPEETKYAMAFLAISGDVKAYRALENYNREHKNNKGSLNDWAALSLLQAKITLESELSDEKQVFISTGLGGEGHRLRFFSFFKSAGLKPFSDYQRALIEKEIPYYIHKYRGILEEQKIEDVYFTILYLIDLSVDIKNMLLDAINECNQYGNFISNSFIITNVKIFNERDIRKELSKADE